MSYFVAILRISALVIDLAGTGHSTAFPKIRLGAVLRGVSTSLIDYPKIEHLSHIHPVNGLIVFARSIRIQNNFMWIGGCDVADMSR
ncbi:TPA: hypothetical protein SLZ45_000979 [Burkholderia multivorans]|nr:hypothetical protein [Burkholderia multivorans]